MELQSLLQKLFRYLVSHDPLLGQIGHQQVIHSGRVTYHKGTEHRTSDLLEASATFEVSVDEIKNYDIQSVCSKIYDFCDNMLGQLKKGFFAELGSITDFSGNVVDAKGKAFSYDMFLQALETVQIQFTKKGDPILPTFVMHPQQAAKLKEIKPTPEQQEREKQIIDKKRREYLVSKRSRRLSQVSF